MKTKPTSYKVLLTFFQDNANGEYGLAHENAIDRGFNAFWTGQGIFHDVFEHYFEENNKYFQNKFGFNIGGEICAMGHLAYYWEMARPENRKLSDRSTYPFEHSIAHTTISDMEEAISEGYTNFGSRLECAVPKQKDVNSYILTNIIHEHLYCMEVATISEKCYEIEAAKEFKRSITDNKIINLYTYGYKLAEQIAPNTEHNKKALFDFIDFWKEFCSNHSAKELTNEFKHVEFTITTGEEIKWTAEFINHYGERVDCNEVNELFYA